MPQKFSIIRMFTYMHMPHTKIHCRETLHTYSHTTSFVVRYYTHRPHTTFLNIKKITRPPHITFLVIRGTKFIFIRDYICHIQYY